MCSRKKIKSKYDTIDFMMNLIIFIAKEEIRIRISLKYEKNYAKYKDKSKQERKGEL